MGSQGLFLPSVPVILSVFLIAREMFENSNIRQKFLSHSINYEFY